MIIEFWKTGENPITCYSSVKNKRETVRVPKKRAIKIKTFNTQSVIVKSPEGEKEYKSVVLCAAELGLKSDFIYQRLNGHLKNDGEYQFFKSKINQ